MRRCVTFIFSAILLSGAARAASAAEVRLPGVFSDHAVLQRGKPIHVWGHADAGQRVTVGFHAQMRTTSADANGDWELWLDPETAGGPYTLEVRAEGGAQPVRRSDILVGDVWFASGQSNMEFPLAGFSRAPLLNGAQEIANANQPRIRLLVQPRRTSSVILSESDAQWTQCTPETARNFSAVAYFFGREIAERENVPVGLIDVTWGGTPAQSWMSADAIAHFNLTSVMESAGRVAREQGRADALRTQYAAEDAASRAAGQEPTHHPSIANDHGGSWTPSSLFNGMIAPYTAFTIKGAIWYQGETDATSDGAPNYDRVFSALIQDWRNQWAQGKLPFLYVQISSFGHNDATWGTLRDQQRRVADELQDTGMAVTIDAGLSANIHPPDKQTVGHRLALLARELVYGDVVHGQSPTFAEATRDGDRMRVWIAHARELVAHGLKDGDFEVAGKDGRYFPAAAKVDGTTVLVSSPEVRDPVFVRYAWKGTVDGWIVNEDGLPMGTFSSAMD